MNLVVNASMPGWGIGKAGELLITIPSDMRHFRELTMYKTVIYGRKTLDTFPNRKPLPNRNNIILSRDKRFAVEGATICHSVEELKKVLKNYDTDSLFVIGGESVYKLLLPYCKKAYITFSYIDEEADRHFPDLNLLENWSVTAIESTQIEGNIPFRFTEYTNDNPMSL